MQKLQAKSKNVPRNTSLVPCSTTLPLNRDQSLGVAEKSLTCNNLEVNLRQHTGGLKDIMYAEGEGKPSPPFQGRKTKLGKQVKEKERQAIPPKAEALGFLV